jgi:hypothetical protein
VSIIDADSGNCATGQTAVNVTTPENLTLGPNGLDTIENVTYTTFNSANGEGDSVSCPADHPYIVTGGYADGGVQTENDVVTAEFPVIDGSSPEGWELNIYQKVPQDQLVKIWTLCAK